VKKNPDKYLYEIYRTIEEEITIDEEIDHVIARIMEQVHDNGRDLCDIFHECIKDERKSLPINKWGKLGCRTIYNTKGPGITIAWYVQKPLKKYQQSPHYKSKVFSDYISKGVNKHHYTRSEVLTHKSTLQETMCF